MNKTAFVAFCTQLFQVRGGDDARSLLDQWGEACSDESWWLADGEAFARVSGMRFALLPDWNALRLANKTSAKTNTSTAEDRAPRSTKRVLVVIGIDGGKDPIVSRRFHTGNEAERWATNYLAENGQVVLSERVNGRLQQRTVEAFALLEDTASKVPWRITYQRAIACKYGSERVGERALQPQADRTPTPVASDATLEKVRAQRTPNSNPWMKADQDRTRFSQG